MTAPPSGIGDGWQASKNPDDSAEIACYTRGMGSLLDEARVQLAGRRYGQAVATLALQLAQQPADLEALTLLTAVYFDTQRLDEAAATVTRLDTCAVAAVVQHPNDEAAGRAVYLAACLRGRIAEQQGDLDAATRGFALAMAIRSQESMPGTAFMRVATAAGQLAHYRQPADVAFVTGPLFGDPPFDSETPQIRALGGSESVLVGAARAMARAGLRVTVYCPCARPGIYDGVQYRSNHDFAACMCVATPSVVIASRYDAYLDPPLTACRKILWVHDVAEVPFYGRFDPARSACDYIVCLSEYHATAWRARVSRFADRVVLIPNGIDPAHFVPWSGPRRRQLIYASRPSRGLAVCLRSFAALRRRDPSLELVVCGYVPRAETTDLRADPECASFAPLLEMPGVRVAGGLTKAAFAAELQQSQLMLYPNTSPWETSCIAVMEAMACGCPVVTSDRGAIPETLGGDAGGVVVPYTSDEAELSAQLEAAAWQLLSDEHAWRLRSERAATFAAARYLWPVVAQQWLQLLEPYLSVPTHHA
ncbi:MAG: glycosyltransferase family 4 protein [Deltaproteobacteria bacterium]|nr:glycosyltransferase family 4 protein [Deltaproteobacteria bacterium]